MIKSLITLLTLIILPSFFALAIADPNKGLGKGVGHANFKGPHPHMEKVIPGTVPPGLRKSGNYPHGLIKKGKTPAGWTKGEKEGWDRDMKVIHP